MVINSPHLQPSRLAFFWYLNWARHLKYTKETVRMVDFPLSAHCSFGLSFNVSQTKPEPQPEPSPPAETHTGVRPVKEGTSAFILQTSGFLGEPKHVRNNG